MHYAPCVLHCLGGRLQNRSSGCCSSCAERVAHTCTGNRQNFIQLHFADHITQLAPVLARLEELELHVEWEALGALAAALQPAVGKLRALKLGSRRPDGDDNEGNGASKRDQQEGREKADMHARKGLWSVIHRSASSLRDLALTGIV